MQNCIVCGGQLAGKQKKLCSTRCKNQRLMQSEAWKRAKRRSEAKPEAKAKKREREENAKVQRTCDMCGKTWKVQARKFSLYCSPLCARLAQLPPRSCHLPPGHPALPVPPPALPPGRHMQSRAGADSTVTATPARLFMVGRCLHCGAAFTELRRQGPGSNYCSSTCTRRAAKASRRAAMRNAEREPISRHRVFERDQWSCYLCGGPINRNAVAPYHPMAPTVDHVVPLARGGGHLMANLRAAHFICNSRKNSRILLADMDLAG
ncbi:HNH endonuclease [Streptomyces sp. FxanaA7]|uniref:HNH endonuclease n=1 Tax=Streptomyces sp. FxanaA7 TaxID=1265492 RepID=UPI00099DEA74